MYVRLKCFIRHIPRLATFVMGCVFVPAHKALKQRSALCIDQHAWPSLDHTIERTPNGTQPRVKIAWPSARRKPLLAQNLKRSCRANLVALVTGRVTPHVVSVALR